MKRVILSSKDQGNYFERYKGIDIYYKQSDGSFYIYSEHRGKGKIEFVSEEDARDYIDRNM